MDRKINIIEDLEGKKHQKNAKYGWYRYDSRLALPVYDDAGEVERYNIFVVRMLVRHAENGKKYLYDFLRIKKKRAPRLSYKLYGRKTHFLFCILYYLQKGVKIVLE